MFPLDDTIAAIASPPGGAARGIVRISGPAAIECVTALFHPENPGDNRQREDSRQCEYSGADIPVCHEAAGDGGRQEGLPHFSTPAVLAGSLHLPALHSPMPCDLYLWGGRPACTKAVAGETPGPQVRSYTGQPVVEIHTIGSPPLLEMILRAVCAAGARLAAPGEFTLRAFLAGRIDLTQAEAVLGVIDADDGPALAVALSQLAGGLARPLHRLRDELLELLAHVEAGFDFADEDLPFITREELDDRLAQAESQLALIERQMHSRAEPVDVVRAVLVGRPNTGKSSLFNAIVGSASALVSQHAGTTRDYLSADLDLDGVQCRLIDTAGIGEKPLAPPHDDAPIEHAAQLAAESQHRSADVQVLCLDCTRPLDDWERSHLEDAPIAGQRVVAWTKCDAGQGIEGDTAGVRTSSHTGEGVDALRSQLRQAVVAAAGTQGDVVASTAARCRESLRLAEQSLRQARTAANEGQEELAAADVRAALEELGKVVGAVYTDDVLDRIFSRFCVGK
jgi:tRNA modification GTPase